MPLATNKRLAARLQGLREHLSTELAGKAEPTAVQALLDQIEPLETLVSRNRRRRTLVWGLRAGIAMLFLMLLLSVFRLRSADVTLTGEASALWFGAGETTENVLPESPLLRRIVLDTRDIQKCLDTAPAPSSACAAAATIQLNALRFYPRASASLRMVDGCMEVNTFRGAGQVVITSQPAPGQTSESGLTTTRAELTTNSTISICPVGSLQLYVLRPAELTLADRLPLGAADRLELPSATNASLSIGAVDSHLTLDRTEVIALRGLSDAVLVARVSQGIVLSAVAQATAIGMSNGTGTPVRDLMPTALEWLWKFVSTQIARGFRERGDVVRCGDARAYSRGVTCTWWIRYAVE